MSKSSRDAIDMVHIQHESTKNKILRSVTEEIDRAEHIEPSADETDEPSSLPSKDTSFSPS